MGALLPVFVAPVPPTNRGANPAGKQQQGQPRLAWDTMGSIMMDGLFVHRTYWGWVLSLPYLEFGPRILRIH